MPLPFPNSHLYLIAINEYDDNGIDNLRSPVNDAAELERILTAEPHGFIAHRPADTSHEAIIELLSHMPAQMQPQDRVLLYFAGHGITVENENGKAEGYILPKNGRLGELGRNWISMSTLLQHINALPCIHALIILDCCFAGSILWADYNYRDVRVPPRRMFKEHFDFYIKEKAWQVLVSAAFDQTAKDVGWRSSPGRSLSPFVEALSKGLSGEADFHTSQHPPDGIITVTELAFFLRQEIEQRAIAEKITHRQTPRLINLKNHDKGEYIFLNPVQSMPRLPSAVDATKENNPFKGLQTYGETDEERFYGRDRVTKEMTERFHQEHAAAVNPLLIVTGISGSGKSSVIGAGVTPSLKKSGWRHLGTIRPGEKPLESWQLLSLPASGEKSFAVIDQLEELVTQNKNKEQAEAFMTLLFSLYKSPYRVGIIITLRSDFESQIRPGPFAALWHDHMYRLPWFNRSELRDVIIRPAANIAFFYEPITLIDKIIDDVLQYPGSLPMLSVLLGELYLYSIRRAANGAYYARLLYEADYVDIKGVSGALQSKLKALLMNEKMNIHALQCILLRMVNIENGIYTRKKASIGQLTYSGQESNIKDTIGLLEEERIITTVEGYENTWEPVHDAVVRWEELGRWIEAIGSERLAVQAELENGIGTYGENGKKSADLWHNNERLDKLYGEMADKTTGHSMPRYPANDLEITFIFDSFALKRRNKRRRRREIAAAFAALVVALITVFVLLIRSNNNRDLANANSIRAQKSEQLAIANGTRASKNAAEARLALYQYEKERYNALIKEGDDLLNGNYLGNALKKYQDAHAIAYRYPQDDSILNNPAAARLLLSKIDKCSYPHH